MFYSQFILAKKGTLGTIWIAAHLERKLRKNQVADTDIGVSVDSILFPDVPIALRLSSHLLLGVVRIYSRKVNYLFDDCSEALLKVKQAFRSTAVDLPPEESTAPYHSITLPETFDLDDFELPDSDILQGNYVDHHVSTREQITLQDTMEGVVYSTSKFGLDERFGDGDASGLDLDEEIFLNKVAASGHAGVMLASDAVPCASAQSMSPLEEDEIDGGINGNSKIDGLAENTDGIEYAQAPCTPGLVEEPNLSKTQEASAGDDQLELVEELNFSNVQEASVCDYDPESENHHITNFAAKEDMTSITSNPDNQLKSQGDSPSTAGNSVLAEAVRAISPGSEFSYRNHTASDSVNGLQQNGVDSNNELGSRSNDGTQTDLVELRVSLDETSCPNLSNEVHVVENNCGKSCISTTCQPVSEYVTKTNQAVVRPEVPNNEVNAGNMEEQCPTNIDEKLAAADIHVLQPCKHLNQLSTLNFESDVSAGPLLPSDVSGLCSFEISGGKEATHASGVSTNVEGEGCFTKHHLEENKTTEPASSAEIQADINKHTDQDVDVILGDGKIDSIAGSEKFELPAPEKLLSVPEGFADLQDNFMESTPDGAHLLSGGGDDAGININSQKKRSFTESTLTVQSLDSVESLAGARSKRTKEYIPDDDDLLASILVGRRSSVLKIMPTPTPQPQVTRMKRQQSAPRVSASKRKILMDDAMILHGDVIRQQLTSTEDIRRTRKKAPCTRPEIWMIQKEFLEDEIFSEPIFTGFCGGLALLHSQTYDLSEIVISQIDAHNPFLEAATKEHVAVLEDVTNPFEVATNMGFSVGPNVHNDAGMDGTNECLVGGNHVQAAHPENQQAEDHVLRLQGYDTPLQMEAICDVPVPDAVNPGIDFVFESASSPNFGFGYENNVSADSALRSALFDKAEENNDSAVVGTAEARVRDELLEGTEVGLGSSVDMQTACGANPSLATSAETGLPSDQVTVTIGTVEEVSRNEHRSLPNEDEVLVPELGYDMGKNLTSYGSNEELKLASSYPVELNVDVNNISSNDGEYPGPPPGYWEADPHCTMEADISVAAHTATVDCSDMEYAVDWHDTGFLNADDEDYAEDEECMPSAEQTSFLENSGWSSRSRAVAKYLQLLFEKEAEHGRKVLPMDNLLVGKTRKEASRMFFEALVLKTRDYIHVEQEAPFGDINIKPRVMLMKSDL
ncbi:sister chromatid cohesion 1 protein 4 isoform X2 [Rhododendron vialii]|uniref:sister chromatid cohesion 1 protein 4 isoform X2 n=1 Tax=Rhododendron vialii TaxID=182163 RepID=UPI0026603B30|nr:sister chromatid cohesion 1 protein 4 isoform X2 [Rhododendron vialii]